MYSYRSSSSRFRNGKFIHNNWLIVFWLRFQTGSIFPNLCRNPFSQTRNFHEIIGHTISGLGTRCFGASFPKPFVWRYVHYSPLQLFICIYIRIMYNVASFYAHRCLTFEEHPVHPRTPSTSWGLTGWWDEPAFTSHVMFPQSLSHFNFNHRPGVCYIFCASLDLIFS